MDHYKIDIIKLNDTWFARLCQTQEINPSIEMWVRREEVTASSYSELQFEMADKGFIDKLNKN